MKNTTIGLLGLALGMLFIGTIQTTNGEEHSDNPMNLGSHHKDSTFTLGPGHSKSLELPRVERAIFMVESNTANGTITIGAVTVDPSTGFPINCGVCIDDGQVKINPIGPNQELAAYNITTNETITFHVSLWY